MARVTRLGWESGLTDETGNAQSHEKGQKSGAYPKPVEGPAAPFKPSFQKHIALADYDQMALVFHQNLCMPARTSNRKS